MRIQTWLSPRVPFVLLTIAIAVTGCGNPDEFAGDEDSGELLAQQENDFDEKGIIRGVASNDHSVVLYGCSATVIGPRTVITSAHCFSSNRPVAGSRVLKVKGQQIKADFIPHPSFRGNTEFDIAVGFTAVDLEVTPHKLGSGIWGGNANMIGFGCSVKEHKVNGKTVSIGYGTQRRGSVSVRKWYRGNYGVQATGAAACGGDSGGALIQGGTLVGVTSRSDRKSKTYFTWVGHPHHRSFILNTAAKRKSPVCGAQTRGCQPKLFSQEIAQANDQLKKERALLNKTNADLAKAKAETTKMAAEKKRIADLIAKEKAAVAQNTAKAAAEKKAGRPFAAIDKQLADGNARIKSLNAQLKTADTKFITSDTSAKKLQASVTALNKKLKDLEARLRSLDA